MTDSEVKKASCGKRYLSISSGEQFTKSSIDISINEVRNSCISSEEKPKAIGRSSFFSSSSLGRKSLRRWAAMALR